MSTVGTNAQPNMNVYSFINLYDEVYFRSEITDFSNVTFGCGSYKISLGNSSTYITQLCSLG